MRCRRDRTVPGGMSKTAAASALDMPSHATSVNRSRSSSARAVTASARRSQRRAASTLRSTASSGSIDGGSRTNARTWLRMTRSSVRRKRRITFVAIPKSHARSLPRDGSNDALRSRAMRNVSLTTSRAAPPPTRRDVYRNRSSTWRSNHMATESSGATFSLPSAVVASRIHMTLARRGVSCSPMAGLSANATRPALDPCAFRPFKWPGRLRSRSASACRRWTGGGTARPSRGHQRQIPNHRPARRAQRPTRKERTPQTRRTPRPPGEWEA